MLSTYDKKNNRGFTLVEAVVSVAVFLVVVLGLFNGLSAVSKIAKVSRLRTMALMVVNERLELARHLPYGDLGIVDGWPTGKLAAFETLERGGISWGVTTTVRSIDDPYDGTIGGNPNDTSPADYKLVEVLVSCGSCGIEPISVATNIAPLALETANGNGALLIKAIDASGLPVVGASVVVVNDSHVPSITINDVTDNTGTLALVDLPPGALAYKVRVGKSGYSHEETYAAGESGIVNPVNPNATISEGAVTQISLPIDKLSTVNLRTIDQFCQGIGSFSFNLSGTKLLGRDPDVLKYSQDLTTDSMGYLTLNNFEWDNYHILPSDASYDVVGSFPLLSIPVDPDTTNDVLLVLAPKASRGLLITAKDGASGLPLDGANITITGTSTGAFFEKVTNRGHLRETDWSAAGGEIFNLEANDPAGEIKLTQVLDSYVPEGYYTSSIFDVGSATTTYYQLSWQPATQATSTGENSVRFQLATSDLPEGPWEFVGPDGTAGSYYTSSETNVNSIHTNERYIRYKLLLSTEDESVTPRISDMAITYSSLCLPFGQVYFDSLAFDNYIVSVTRDGYQDFTGEILVSNDWQSFEASLNSL
ncbi:MAG TPA: prepilin-type N-terminal cleavage/methylation domain-containing protein [Candidatus Paceibacterota bacterium]|nr:prepilin-type N-terminal cleavage/methylation domain-containing protein [Candidatus Paceibacterota bacterium]HQI25965.1 prepilin-type N-terminal cleavage/methylation domain-containing protein [Candidatus Paceibacterota bacterium]